MQTQHTKQSKEISKMRWKNDFLPDCRNKDFGVKGLIGLLRYGVPWEKIPEDAKPFVKAELSKRVPWKE